MRAVLAVLVLGFAVSSFGLAYGHTAKVVGDYKLDVGWQDEPPQAGVKNAIEVVISLATQLDKSRFENIIGIEKGQVDQPSNEKDVSGLAEKLQVDVKLGDKKDFLTLVEDPKHHGVYHGEYTPHVVGKPNVHLYGMIKNIEFEATFHPETVEEAPQNYSIPDWIKNNAGWWSEGKIGDSDFVSGIQYLIKQQIIKIPQTTSGLASSEKIPDWIKNNAGWWSEGKIGDSDFVSGIQYLIENGIMQV